MPDCRKVSPITSNAALNPPDADAVIAHKRFTETTSLKRGIADKPNTAPETTANIGKTFTTAPNPTTAQLLTNGVRESIADVFKPSLILSFLLPVLAVFIRF
ncbi:MAG TPA: hypothetical protein DCZ23_05250 [Lachnospiraceae bacterium]|nr:hypothetical protein [Lachnospiraceae bacterium]